MTGIFNQLHHIGIHPRFYQSLPDDGNQCGIGMDGIATAAQNNGIAGFKGQRKRIDRNIRAAFKIMATTPKGTRFELFSNRPN